MLGPLDLRNPMATKAVFTVAKLHRTVGEFDENDEGRLRNALRGVAGNSTEVTYVRKPVSQGTFEITVVTCHAEFTQNLDLNGVDKFLRQARPPHVAYGAIALEHLTDAGT